MLYISLASVTARKTSSLGDPALDTWDFPGSSVADFSFSARVPVRSLGWEDHLEKGMATHTSILAWRITTNRGV